jgi:hypothetical protein
LFFDISGPSDLKCRILLRATNSLRERRGRKKQRVNTVRFVDRLTWYIAYAYAAILIIHASFVAMRVKLFFHDLFLNTQNQFPEFFLYFNLNLR